MSLYAVVFGFGVKSAGKRRGPQTAPTFPSISHTLLVAAFWAKRAILACSLLSLTIDPSLVWFRVLALFYRDFGHVNGAQVSQKITDLFFFPP